MTSFERHELRRGEAGYPAPLAEAETLRPPEVLYVAGDPSVLGSGLAIIGARRATPYGLTAARRFAGWTAAQGVTIVSGAARGCDQAAQQAAVDAGGFSVAVLGCGADVDYPASSRSLLAHLRRHGAVVSELRWGMEPHRNAFAARNRIIAGLSRAVLVVEAGLPSGTFSTAEQALKADREVWAVPGSIFAPECRGANALISQGATVIADVSDLAMGVNRLDLLAPGMYLVPSVVSTHDDSIMRALVADPMRADDLARELLMDVVVVMRRIAQLEVTGKVVRLRDGRYAPAPVKEQPKRGGERPG